MYRGPPVRNLERNLATILRKIARKVASGATQEQYIVDTKDVEPYLGLPSGGEYSTTLPVSGSGNVTSASLIRRK